MGDGGSFVSGSKSSLVSIIDMDTGTVLRVNDNSANNKKFNSQRATCSTADQNATVLASAQNSNNSSSFLLVINHYKLHAVNLNSQQSLWSLAFSELTDMADRSSYLSLATNHLGYDLVLPSPTLLKAVPSSWAGDRWEFRTSAPIVGVYQLIGGSRLAKLRVTPGGLGAKRNLTHFVVKDYNSVTFASDLFGSADENELAVPFTKRLRQSPNELMELRDYRRGLIKGPSDLPSAATSAVILLGLVALGAVCIARMSTKEHIARTSEAAVGEDFEGQAAEGENAVESADDDDSEEKKLPAGTRHSCPDRRKKTDSVPSDDKEDKKDAAIQDGTEGEDLESHAEKHVSGSQVRVGHLTICTDQILGYGSLGTIVYRGKFEHRDVAVKRMLRPFHEVATKEIATLIVSDNHPNVIRYYTKEEDKYVFAIIRRSEFMYLALEKCEGSLDQLIDLICTPISKREANPKLAKLSKLFKPSELTDETLLSLMKDSMEGLCFLHSMNIVHRDLKPQNILISQYKKAKLSDMGLSRQLRQDEHSFETNASGSWGWQPAEVLRGEKRHSSIDVFSMGCILYHTLTCGKHPFGDKYSRERNILQGKYDISALENANYEACNLVEHMIAFGQERRPTLKQCLNHILFWDEEKKLNFLCDVIDKVEYDIGVHQHSMETCVIFG